MPTSHKTGLGLNAWVGSDCPMRQDFVDDNTLLDELISTHINNQEQHLSAADRALLESGIVIGRYTGDGAASKICHGVYDDEPGGAVRPGEKLQPGLLRVRASGNLQRSSGFKRQHAYGLPICFRAVCRGTKK